MEEYEEIYHRLFDMLSQMQKRLRKDNSLSGAKSGGMLQQRSALPLHSSSIAI